MQNFFQQNYFLSAMLVLITIYFSIKEEQSILHL